MKDCKKCRELIVEVLYNELPDSDKVFFFHHIQNCTDCANEYQQMKATLDVMDKRTKQQPSDEFWENYWEKLENRVSTEVPANQNRTGRFQSLFSPPRWTYQLAAAAVLILFGIFLGKFVMNSTEENKELYTEKSTMSSEMVQRAAVQQEAYRYFERSKILLLGIVNYDTQMEKSARLDFSRQKNLAKDLIHQSAVLKDDLRDSNQQRLLSLVDDLQLILMQIANLEAEEDLNAIEMIRAGVDRKAIFLKINLEQISKGKQKSIEKSNNNTKGKDTKI